MGPKERRQREREETRTRILDAARDLFVAEGYDAVTMRRIADRIEYSPTAIYFHFRDKEALLKELCATDFLALARELATLDPAGDVIESFRAIGLAYVRFGMQYPNHYRLMFMTPHPPVGPADVDVEQGNPEEDAYALLKSIIARAIAEGRLKPQYTDVELVSQTAWAGVHGVVSLQIAKCNDDWVEWREMDTRTRVMIDVLVDGLAR